MLPISCSLITKLFNYIRPKDRKRKSINKDKLLNSVASPRQHKSNEDDNGSFLSHFGLSPRRINNSSSSSSSRSQSNVDGVCDELLEELNVSDKSKEDESKELLSKESRRLKAKEGYNRRFVDYVADIPNERKKRNDKEIFHTEIRQDMLINEDAKNYEAMLKDSLEMQTCAVCGIEESKNKFKLLSNYERCLGSCAKEREKYLNIKNDPNANKWHLQRCNGYNSFLWMQESLYDVSFIESY